MKGLLIYRVDFADISNHGVALKAKGQAKAYRNAGVTLDIINIYKGAIHINDQLLLPLSGISTLYKNHRVFWNKLRTINLSVYDFVHLRHPYATPWLLSFTTRLLPAVTLLVELPTFPYDEEFKKSKKLLLKIDHHYRKSLFEKTSYIIHYGQETELFNVPCINITNGVDLEVFPLRNHIKKDNKIRLIAVGKWQYWHGLDRVIKGIAASNKNVILTIIGEGPENKNLKTLSATLGIEGQVTFVGSKKGKELDNYFNKADIAIGTLGMHRKNVKIDASLKHREYAARGIPFIYAGTDLDFNSNCPFVKIIASNDLPVNMSEVLTFKEISNESISIHNYAKSKLSWNSRMKKILNTVSQKD